MKFNDIYIHVRTGKEYRVITPDGKVKIDGAWHDAVSYCLAENSKDHTLYTRTKENFEGSFIKKD